MSQNLSRNSVFHWYAVSVRPNSEKSTAAALIERGVKTFSPHFTTRRLWSDRTKDLEVPLFPGYVFCALEPSTPAARLSVAGVIGLNGRGQGPVVVDEREILHIQTLCDSGFPVQPWPFVSEGTKIQVASGPLRGVGGILIGHQKLVVSLRLLQRSVAVDLSGSEFEVSSTASTGN